MNNIYSVIDLGTNNIQLLIAKNRKNTEIILRDSKVTELGKNFKNHIFTQDKAEKTIELLQKFIKISKKYTDNILIIGTSIFREAKPDNLIAAFLKKSDIPFHIISGEEEARLNGLANVDDFEGNFVLFDIGGGSTEFTFISDKKIVKNVSIPLGIRRLDNNFCNLYQKREETKKLISNIQYKFDDFYLVGIGGTVTSLSFLSQKLEKYQFDKIHKSRLEKAEITKIFDDIATIHIKDYKDSIIFKLFSLELLATGVLIVEEILNHFGKDNLFISDKGLMFGVLQDEKYKF